MVDQNSVVQVGAVLAGKYRVERVLGEGGMGVVVEAHHLQLDERVALKFLHAATANDGEAVARFQREARAAVKIKSEHVARITDVGCLESGAPYIVMEYLQGTDLAAWIVDRGPLPIEQAVDFVLQAGEAIAEAHALRIVHRDLKPANLFCVRRRDGALSIKVLDFGISKTTGLGASAPQMGMTRTQAMLGSPLYMSPEQMQTPRGVDARTDIWSLGVILFELATGRVPFEAETFPELVLKVMTAPAPRLRTLRPDAPAALESIVARCLEKDRSARYGSVAELAVALQAVAPASSRASIDVIVRLTQGLASTTVAPPASGSGTARTGAGVAASTVDSWGQATGDGRRASGGSRTVVAAVAAVGAAALVVALGAVGVVHVVRSRHAQAVAAPPAPSALAAPVEASAPAPAPTLPAPPAASGSTATIASATASASAPSSTSTSTRAHAAPPAARHPTITKRPDCATPYYFDPQGDRVFKKECL